MKRKEDNKTKEKKKWYRLNKVDIISLIISAFIILSFLLSPTIYIVNTARWTKWDEKTTDNVVAAMGSENTEDNFRLYFQYYNVLHELGHGMIRFNNGVKIHIVDEEQLVNDFAVAYWRYYGEESKIKQLKEIVDYAVVNVGDNYEKGVDYIEIGKENSDGSTFYQKFFNFNDYGWFQFSSVKHSLENPKELSDVLKEMGMKDFKLTEKKTLVHKQLSEKESTIIINEAIDNFNEWGLKFPKAYQLFQNDPNMNSSAPFKNFFWIFDFLTRNNDK